MKKNNYCNGCNTPISDEEIKDGLHIDCKGNRNEGVSMGRSYKINFSEFEGSYSIDEAKNVLKKMRGKIDQYYEDLKLNLIECLFHLPDEEAKDCIREFIKDHPEILDRYTKDELLEL